MNKKGKLIRSSAAEYLTFVAATAAKDENIEIRYEDENLWLTQKLMSKLYGVEVHTINYHINKVFKDSELDKNSVIRNFRITAEDGKEYNTMHYNLSMIIAVGFKVDNEKAVQFRKWANTIVNEYTIKGFAMDDERFKNNGSILTKKYFEEQLQRIREIRLSERVFYQKITDIYATSIDYDFNSAATKRFYASVQNKLHWAIHGHTAAELIVSRANANKTNMGLTTWKDAPQGKIQKFDVSVAKNYLSDIELASLSRIVSAFLDLAELKAIDKTPMTMADWESQLNRYLNLLNRNILKDAGRISAELAKAHAETEFEKYRIVQDKMFESDFDKVLKQIKATQGGENE